MKGDRWVTKSGVVVIETGRKTVLDRRGRKQVKIYAEKAETGGRHGLLWLKNLRPRVER